MGHTDFHTLGTVAAVGLSNSRLPYKTLLMGLLISPMIVPLVITACHGLCGRRIYPQVVDA